MTRSGAILAVLVLACSAPRTGVAGRHCEVRVPRHVGLQRAGELAIRTDWVSAWVAELLSLSMLDGVIVEVDDERYLDGVPGSYGRAYGGDPPGILLGMVCLDDLEFFDRAVAHELAHCYLARLPVEEIPYLVDEGIAEHVGLVLGRAGELDERLRASVQAGADLDPQLLELTYEEFSELTREARSRFCEAGLELVRRVGLDVLMERCKTGELSHGWLRAAMAQGAARN